MKLQSTSIGRYSDESPDNEGVCTFCQRRLKKMGSDHREMEFDSTRLDLNPGPVHTRPTLPTMAMGLHQHTRNKKTWIHWANKRTLSTLGIILILTFLPITEATITAVFSGSSQSNSIRVNHLALSSSGELYIGATNYIFRLASNLSLVEEVQTGPQLDSIDCRRAWEDTETTCTSPSGTYDKVSTDNINKILLVDSSENKLVICGSIFQGVCDLLPLSSISENPNFITSRDNNIIVAANTAEASTVGILAPGLPNPLIDHVLYSGTTLGGNIELRAHEMAAVSSRAVVGQNLFEFVVDNSHNGEDATFLQYLNDDCYSSSLVTYVDAFSEGGYTYFLTIQHSIMCSESTSLNYISKIVQICQSDDSFTSYIEMPLSCGDYNLIQDVTLIEASGTLAQMLGSGQGDQIVVAVFTKSEANSNISTSESAVCMYKLTDIRAQFETNINNCYSGTGSLAPLYRDLGDESLECDDTPGFNPGPDFCGNDFGNINLAMAGASGTSATPMLTVASTKFTSVVAHNINSYTTLFLGTGQGQVKKV